MQRAYYKWFSPNLNKDMQLLVFGHAGPRILFFPTRAAHFYDYEDWKVIDAISDKVAAGQYQLICVDSIDSESFYNKEITPAKRIERHIQYEQYILNEVIPFTTKNNTESKLYAAGASLGAYHAVNIAFKHPEMFTKVIGMSGRYDLTVKRGVFTDLFDGYTDENVYYNMPNEFIANLNDEKIIQQLKQMEIIIAIGNEDAFLEDSRYLSTILWDKQIVNSLYIWEGEAHKAKAWREMVRLYF